MMVDCCGGKVTYDLKGGNEDKEKILKRRRNFWREDDRVEIILQTTRI